MEEEKKSSQDWFNALELSKKEMAKWQERGEKIVKRYRDERSEMSGNGRKYNILWSNIRTLLPAVYAKKPKAECQRRHKDADPVGRAAAQVLERALQYEIDQYSDFDSGLRHSILDRLLPGRGVAWVRFEPAYKPGQPEDVGESMLTDDVEPEMADTTQLETSPVDYVYWQDFRHSPARTWEEVTWVARRVYMAKEEGVERFGDDFKSIPLSHVPVGVDKLKAEGVNTEQMKKAVVWEIWDKSTKLAHWVAVGSEHILDTKPDPLELDCFFPCPKPLFATLTTDSLVPVADYVMYQDQAAELDTLTERIGKLVEAVKVVGVYDSSAPGIQRMLNEGVDNTLIPVDTWAAFGERGGLKGSVDFLPLDMVVNALQQLYAAREAAKQVIYEVTGLSDIIRGASVASETATAQQIKSQYASLRLKEMQSDVARFASDILKIKAQIMCAFYRPESLVAISGMDQTQDAQYLPQALQLLQNDTLRAFRIEVETDSLVELDEAQEKSDRMEFLQAAGAFIREAVQAPPELAPLMGEMLMFGVRSFKAGKSMEASLEQFIKTAQEKAKQPQQQKPDPEMMKLQANQQVEQGRMQLEQAKMQAGQQAEQMKLQADMQAEQAKAQMSMQLEAMKAEQSAQMEAQKIEFERWKAELEASTKVTVAEIQAKTSLKQASISANASKESEGLTEVGESGDEQPTSALAGLVDAINQNMANLMGLQQQSHAQIIEQVSKPRNRVLQRGPDGRAVGAVEV